MINLICNFNYPIYPFKGIYSHKLKVYLCTYLCSQYNNKNFGWNYADMMTTMTTHESHISVFILTRCLNFEGNYILDELPIYINVNLNPLPSKPLH